MIEAERAALAGGDEWFPRDDAPAAIVPIEISLTSSPRLDRRDTSKILRRRNFESRGGVRPGVWAERGTIERALERAAGKRAGPCSSVSELSIVPSSRSLEPTLRERNARRGIPDVLNRIGAGNDRGRRRAGVDEQGLHRRGPRSHANWRRWVRNSRWFQESGGDLCRGFGRWSVFWKARVDPRSCELFQVRIGDWKRYYL